LEKFVFEKQHLCSPLVGVHTVPGTIISLVCDNTKHKELVGDNTNHRELYTNLVNSTTDSEFINDKIPEVCEYFEEYINKNPNPEFRAKAKSFALSAVFDPIINQ
jgi:hypothetical protein